MCASDALELFLRDLIVVVVKKRVVLKNRLDSIEEDGHILSCLEKVEEETSVALEDISYHFQILGDHY